MILSLLAASLAHGSALVLESPYLKRVSRAVKVARKAEATRIVPLGPTTVCVELPESDPRTVLRLTRRLRHSPESRSNCDVAWYPLGLGWIALLIEPPAEELESALEAVALPYHDVRRGGEPTAAVRLCASRAAVGDPLELADELERHGVVVRAVYEVGGCERP